MNEFWHNRAVFVTGASGFLGSWLVKALVEARAEVVVLLRDWDPQSLLIRDGVIQRVHIVQGALEDYAAVERALNEYEVDTVFHLGAQTIVGSALRSPLATFESNIRGTYHLLDACRLHAQRVKRVIVASSDKAYGTCATLPYDEETPLVGQHPYDVSKSCADLLTHAYYHTYGLPIAVTRCGNLYGGGDMNWSRIVPGTIRSLLRREAPVIRSDGQFTRDYLYVEDAVQAYLTTAEALERLELQGQAFNFAPEQPRTVLDIVNALCRLMEANDLAPRILNAASGEIRDQYLSADKARRLLNWTPRFTLDDGLTRSIAWYSEYLHDAAQAVQSC